MQKNKVVVIHNIVSPHVTKLFQEFSRFVNLTVLYCSQGEENRTWHEKITGFKYEILPSFSIKLRGKDLFTYFINLTVLEAIGKLNPEVIILAGWDLFAYQIAFLYCKIKGIKVILWSGSTAYEKSWRRSVSLPLVKTMIKGSDAFIAYGTRSMDYLIKNGAKVETIFKYGHTTDIDKYQAKRHKVKEKVIIFYGQLIERKGIDVLVKAFAILRKKDKDVRLKIIGSGSCKNELLQQVTDLHLENFVDFAEDPGDSQISKYWSNASLLVLPSREEVWGLVVNEAMAAGLPIIVSDVVGCSVDLVENGKNGYIFKSGSATDLEDKIEKIITNSKTIANMGSQSLRIIKEFTPLNSAKTMASAVDFVQVR